MIEADEAIVFADVVKLGIQARVDMDTGRYVIGDLAILLKAHYGDEDVKHFASEIKIEAKTVYEYKSVCEFYPQAIRAEYIKDCNYSMLRAAKRLGNLEDAMILLDKAIENVWNSRDIEREVNQAQGQPVQPALVYDGAITVLRRVPGIERPILEVEFADIPEGLREKGKYTVKFYAMD